MSENQNPETLNTPESGYPEVQENSMTNGSTGNIDVSSAGDDAMSEWSQAMAEQNSKTLVDDQEPTAPANIFKSLNATPEPAGQSMDINFIKDIPVELSVELGRQKITIQKLLQLSQGSVVELTSLAGEPMNIFINGYYIAQGEVVVVGDKYGVRLTDIVTPSERLAHFSAKR